MDIKAFCKEKVKPKFDAGVEKVKAGGKKVVETTKIVGETFVKNPMLAVMFISTVGSTVVSIANTISKNKDEEEDRCTTYDSYAGMDITTTHELSNQEILEMTERMKAGQKKVEALNDMGLLREDKKRK